MKKLFFSSLILLSGCAASQNEPISKDPVLYSRLWRVEDGKEMVVSPWKIDGEGTFETDTIIFIDELTGYYEFAYTNQILSKEYQDR